MTIKELEDWFNSHPLPQPPVYLNNATKVNDIKQFLESHFAPLRIDPNSKVNQPLIDRLLDMKLLIEANL